MFTGIIKDVGKVLRLQERGGDVRLTIESKLLPLQALSEGDSIAVNGACLTALEINTHEFSADVSRETLAVTSLGQLRSGSLVNLEGSLRLGDSLDGHLVSGHVDATTTIKTLRNDGRSWRVRLALPNELRQFIAAKGSITVDGVSLTVNDVKRSEFGVNIIPHTYENTVFKNYRSGSVVNLEVDLIARYTARILSCASSS